MTASNNLSMTKQQTEYAPHDADSLIDGWNAVSEYAENCVLIAFDGCHKIYLAMDQNEAHLLRHEYGYEITVDNNGENDLMDILDDWYEGSCPLKFIQAVWGNEAEPNDGFVELISQSAGDDAPTDDDEEY